MTRFYLYDSILQKYEYKKDDLLHVYLEKSVPTIDNKVILM